MAAAVDRNDVWRVAVESPDLVPIGGETDGDYNVFIRELIPSLDSTYEVLELLGKCLAVVFSSWTKAVDLASCLA